MKNHEHRDWPAKGDYPMTHPTPQSQAQRDLIRQARIALSRVITRDNLSRDALAEAVQLLESALASPAQPQVSEDEIISALYRRFKEWSKRGFGPEDVTWCEVKADILKLIEIHSAAILALERVNEKPIRQKGSRYV